MSDLTLELTEGRKCVSIYVDGILHLQFLRAELIGFQAFIEDREAPTMHCVEFTFRTGATILVEWTSYGDWKRYVALLKDRLSF